VEKLFNRFNNAVVLNVVEPVEKLSTISPEKNETHI